MNMYRRQKHCQYDDGSITINIHLYNRRGKTGLSFTALLMTAATECYGHDGPGRIAQL